MLLRTATADADKRSIKRPTNTKLDVGVAKKATYYLKLVKILKSNQLI